MKQRKTLIKEEKWIKLDNWYMGKPPLKNKRTGLWSLSKLWSLVIAHECSPGKFKAPNSLTVRYRNRKGGLGIYGRCSGCGAKVSQKLKQMICMIELV